MHAKQRRGCHDKVRSLLFSRSSSCIDIYSVTTITPLFAVPQVMVLSNGSVTQHLQLLTGSKVTVVRIAAAACA